MNEEDKFDTFIRELPQVKRLYEEKEMLMASNKSLAEYNLSQVPLRSFNYHIAMLSIGTVPVKVVQPTS